MEQAFQCKKCALCCRNIVINIAYSDIVKWFNEGRKDILQEICFINNYPRRGTGGFYIAKTAFNPKQPCPFLENNSCTIYETRPISCRDFPYGHSKSVCPHAKNLCLQSLEVKRRQYRDFKMAYENRKKLLQLLVMARGEQ